nr:hypothetical protein [candidate division Zixibacteria bacterium]NIR64946.1 hypothetical protein [candidate division Zixibacteria bacterium]NIS17880.1 hypothetical protein [candidate division Zixibacteria bacterium]NIS46760.1 hypothetical protein [candidate division Zixibacteria bacterium]NIT54166.1 hypothetical protein [candidate division Zixibacteria bacterium]
MYKIIVIVWILGFLAGALAAENGPLQIDLQDEINTAINSTGMQYFLDSDNWIYGLDSSGFPVYKYSFSVPSGVKPEIESISIQDTLITSSLKKCDFLYSDLSTDAERLSTGNHAQAIQMQEYSGIRIALELHLR